MVRNAAPRHAATYRLPPEGARARKQGRFGGRPEKADDYKLVARVKHLHKEGNSLRQIAAQADVAVNTVRKILAAA